MGIFDGERFSEREACARRSRQSIERRDGAEATGIIGEGNA
ncbi:hypothetical protein MBUL_03825 [Methylobacterium bullatum]|uniref:Uncharacterized protein n=1 Tax=Methylobacterium bullatum TaxID=570505 RepID=A0A679JKI3_9HYPH|nr:hypothetical protein MBUL_03825 [Methylobacterium bullatum]